jgi:L-alanine-DL-glutamate epimerase-like enolase superfamily enzyme
MSNQEKEKPNLSLRERFDTVNERSASFGESIKIADLEWILYDRRQNKTEGRIHPYMVLRITTDNGAQGVCALPTWHSQSGGPELKSFSELLMGKNPLDREGIWEMLYSKDLPLAPISYVDVALWDLYGKMEGKPIHTLLGTRREKVKVYRSTQFNIGPPERYAEYAVECKERGYQGYKIHPYRVWDGENDPDKDIPIYYAVRDAVGSDYNVMSDNFHSYNYEESVRVGKILDELDYTWYESPMPENDEWIESYAKLRQQVNLPVCTVETAKGAHDTRIRWIQAEACDIALIDVFYGGITSCLKTGIACEEAGIRLQIHCNMYPHIQVFGATSEDLLPYLEDYGEQLHWELDKDGCVTVPQTPGVGYELDWEFIEDSRIDWSDIKKR